MSTLHLSAIDTLFFKDGKPFVMGEETWARGVFPPHPSVFYGLLRSIYFSNGNLADLANAKGYHSNENLNDPTKNLRITGLLSTIGGAPFFPVPNDLYAIKREEAKGIQLLKYEEKNENFLSSDKHSGLLQTREAADGEAHKIEEIGGTALLNETEFKKYLVGKEIKFEVTKLSEHVLDEPKVGIGRNNNTRTTSEGQLYRVSMRRMHGKINNSGKPFGFEIQYEGLNINQFGLSRFGAEIKGVEYTTGHFPPPPTVTLTGNHFKIYLATPCVFEDGAYPIQWFKKHGLILKAAAIGRVLHIGGFDMKAAKPKPMRKAVPGGTVYYVEIDKSRANGFDPLSLHGGSIYQLANSNANADNEFYRKQGFGLCYVGNFNKS